MKLKKYDGRCVRVIDSNGDAFDGICSYNDEEYDEHEFGRSEESLQIENFLFFESDIKEIQSLEEHKGPYGRFLDPYGKLEELTVEDGIDSIRDMLFSEEKDHVLRLLNCLDKYLDPYYGYTFSCYDETIAALEELREKNKDEKILEEVERLLRMWG